MPSDNSDIKKQMIEALKHSLGIVSHAADVIGIHRDTHYDWMKTDEEYRKQVLSLKNEQKDYVESKLFKRIEKEDTTAIIFYCKTQMKDRGYIERQEIDNNIKIEGKPTINLEFSES